MSNGGGKARVSAFAKRKRLNDESGTSTPEPEPESRESETIAPPKKRTKAQKLPSPPTPPPEQKQTRRNEQQQVRTFTPVNLPSIASVLAEAETGSEVNSFEPLVEHNQVAFSGIRQIEKVGRKGVKVRLSRGQICSVTGVARFWVRLGCVTIYGATFIASPRAYTIFESENTCPADICAESKIAEFQLESIPYSGSIFPSELNIPGRLGRQAQAGPTTFGVREDAPGYFPSSFRTRLRASHSAFRAHHTDIARRLEEQSSTGKPQLRPPDRVILCGKSASSTTASSLEWINYFVTTSHQSWSGKGVAFLDLNFLAPTFTGPGTISLSVLFEPALGPSYTFPIQAKQQKSCRLICSFYIGTVHALFSRESIIQSLNKALESLEKEIGEIPLIVRTADWLLDLPDQQLAVFYKSLSPTFTVFEDSSKSNLAHREAIESMPDECGDVLFMTGQRQTTSSALTDHQLLLQSHLRFFENRLGLPLWKHPFTLNRSSLQLPIGSGFGRIAFLTVRGGVLRPEDVAEALQAAVVTLIAVRGHEIERIAGKTLVIRDLPSDEEMHHVGVFITCQFDEAAGMLLFAGSITTEQLEFYWSSGFEIGLVLEKLETEGRYSLALATG